MLSAQSALGKAADSVLSFWIVLYCMLLCHNLYIHMLDIYPDPVVVNGNVAHIWIVYGYTGVRFIISLKIVISFCVFHNNNMLVLVNILT